MTSIDPWPYPPAMTSLPVRASRAMAVAMNGASATGNADSKMPRDPKLLSGRPFGR